MLLPCVDAHTDFLLPPSQRGGGARGAGGGGLSQGRDVREVVHRLSAVGVDAGTVYLLHPLGVRVGMRPGPSRGTRAALCCE